MFRKISDFLDAWSKESDATLKVFRALTDASLEQRVTSDSRSLGFMAWHITTTISEMGTHAGLPLHVTGPDDPTPATAAEIAVTYEKASKAIAEVVAANWTEAQLDEEIPMYGQKWTRGGTLNALIAHQCHHRGQMTVLMRQAGLRVPGVYGPAKEEWGAYGMQAQA